MTVATFCLLVVAGVATGLVGYLTGLASLVSYPALLAAGLPPVAANVTNTIGLVSVGIGSSARSVATLLEHGRRQLGVQLLVAAAGGLVGGAVLLTAGEGSFTRIVPWFVALGAVLLLLSPRIKALRAEPVPRWAYLVGLFVVSVYGGYFGAGAGTIFMALSLIATSELLGRAMILKSALLSVTNLVASALFVIFGPVDWWAAIAMAIGCAVGGNLGPLVQRRVPEEAMRWTIGLAGLGLAAWLLLRA